MDWYRINNHYCICVEEIYSILEKDLKNRVTNIGIRCGNRIKDICVTMEYAEKAFADVVLNLRISYSKVSYSTNKSAGTIKYVIEYR